MKTITVEQKLTIVFNQIGPFDFNNAGYDANENNYNGLQVWGADSDNGQGIQTDRIDDEETIADYDLNCIGYEWVEKADFYKYDGEAFYFQNSIA
jgi:hypothetical protein